MKTIAVDFDGVIHSYTSGWKGAAVCPDPPVPGAIAFVREALGRFAVAIYSTRADTDEGANAIVDYLLRHGLEPELIPLLVITSGKPKAVLYIDDRAYCFGGVFPSLDLIEAFQPWNKQEHPRGRISATDQGQTALAIAVKKNTVILDFGKPVAWIGLGASDARAIAAALLKRADEIES